MLWRIDSFKNNIPYECFWKLIIKDIFNSILTDGIKCLKKLHKFRENIGLFFISNIDATLILEYLLNIATEEIKDTNLLSTIISEIAVYDKRLKNSTRYILHFEGLLNQILNHVVSFKSV
jgi:hypothetical protein